MRSLLLFLVMLAAAKFGWQEWSYRQALADTIITTFRQDAIESCQKEAASRNLKTDYVSWRKPEAVSLIVGSGTADESFWQVSDQMFRASEQNPIIVVVAKRQPYKLLCEYDITKQLAAIYRK
jgi:hypothetical protein